MEDSTSARLRDSLRGRLRFDEPLSRHTSWGIGGPADCFIEPADREDLSKALSILEMSRTPWLPIGSGSNLLVRDGGFRGAMLKLTNFTDLDFGPGGRVRVGGGLQLSKLIRECCRRGLSGLEALYGIPGTVGGAVTMNAGAGGQEIGGVVRDVTLAGAEGEETLDAERCRFGYRSSALGEGRIVVEANLLLSPADRQELEREIERRIAHRKSAQAVGGPNAGSVFKNPDGGQAWKLIEEAGLRGAVEGGARVSEKHCNFIVNAGGATASDVLTLMERIREEVMRKSGVLLEPEVKVVGDD